MRIRTGALHALCLLAGAEVAHAEVKNVTTTAELTAAIGSAQAGDEIVLAAGTYRLSGATCAANGTQQQPIIVRSATPLAAKIELDGLEGFKVTGASWQFEGLDIVGVCATDSACEHAFHVVGGAHDFVLRKSRVKDFNAQVKVNATTAPYVAPDRGLIEDNDIGDSRPRVTDAPVTKLNIDGGDDWVIRRNVLHDAEKDGGNLTSYLAFFKSGGKRGVMEQNLVLCERDFQTSGVQLGLSLGGGLTGVQFCNPEFVANGICSIEHDEGVIRNNIIANCSDSGVYIARARNAKVLYNTIIETGSVDFRYDTTSGEAYGNVLGNVIRTRDGATAPIKMGNLEHVTLGMFQAMYAEPLVGDLTVTGSVADLAMGPAHPQVTNDYCGRPRPATDLTRGALEHSLGACDVTNPGGDGPGTDAGTAPGGEDPAGCCQANHDSSWLLGCGVVALALARPRRRRT